MNIFIYCIYTCNINPQCTWLRIIFVRAKITFWNF